MKKFSTSSVFLLIMTLIILISCNTIREHKSGRTFRYIYKGTTLYECVNNSRGDSIGVVEETELVPMQQYLNEFWSGKDYWRFVYNSDSVFINMDITGWEKIEIEDPNSFSGKLIVKTIILEGDRAGQEVEKMQILILDSTINHDGLDYAPTICPDGKTIYYVSNRPGSKIVKDDILSHDFWAVGKENKYETKFFKPYNIDTTTELGWRSVNTKLNEGVATIAADGRTLFFTGCNRMDGVGGCDIYTAKIFENKWSRPINLGREVNSADWDSQPSISPNQKRLYFASNREGPHGENNMDIWYSEWDEDFEEWLPAQNLMAINTDGNDVAPFIAADNTTLFFSSDGYDSNIGGLDFYVTRYDRETKCWSEPAQLSEPLNTEFDDQFITLPASGDIIYFSSRRQDIQGYQGDLDLFMAFVPSFFRVIVIKCYIADDSGYDIPTYITVDNPVSLRKVKDVLSEKDNVMGMVLTDADYGLVSDSLPYIDLDIKAENQKFGTKKKILRVENPLIVHDRGGWIFTDEIDVTLEISVSPELEEYLKKIGRSILDASISAVGIDEGEETSPPNIIIEEFPSTNMRPLLNYIFFDDNSSKIPEKYIRLSDEEALDFNVNDLHNTETLPTYYNILNIVGKRMNEFPDAVLTLIGCNSNKDLEKGNIELSRQRAMSISNYLSSVWDIDESRIKIESRNLPEVPSNSLTIEGVEENRRVDVYSDNSNILAPIVTNDILLIAKPPIINFNGMVSVKGGEAAWKFTARQDDDTLKVFSGDGSLNEDLVWELNKEKTTIPRSESPLIFELEVKDKNKDKVIVAKGNISVKQITSTKKSEELIEDKRIDRFSLILFNFGESELDDKNIDIIKFIEKNIKNNSIIEITGYSDRIGNDAYNMGLSEKRANKTASALGKDNSIVRGLGESKLLYDNELPEGRFYCRTVEIIVETPIDISGIE